MRSSGKIINNKIPEEISTAFANHQYVPIEKIGEGGFCTVFKAKNQKTGQLVAVKTLKRQAKESQESYEKNLIRFNREAELCAKLNHPNIIMLLDRGQRGDVHYSVFELVKGRSLKEALFEHNSLCPVAAADIMSQVLQALFHAHQQGIVHRDIKPANIMLNKQGQKTYVKLLDFGISAHSSNQQAYVSHKPSIDEMTGTMSYVAPEQLRGCLPTPKSDIYAWGLVFLECLTGTRVMSGTCLPSIIQQQLCSNDILLPETIENHPVSDIIKAAIKKDGEKRIEDASELYEKLSHIDLSTLSQSTTTHRQALSTYTDNRNAPQTLIFNDTKTLLDTEQPQAITALCITIALHCNSNAHELIDKKSRETLLRRLYEEKKNQCISVIQKYGATLAGRLVDTLLFYFGYPKTLSTDSLICAKAALEIAQTLNQPVYMDDKRIKIFCTVHIGIHASSFWKGNHAFPDGEIPRTAMTLARSAGANQILCSRPTHDILCSQAYFETSYIEKYYQYNTQSPSYAIIREHGETTVDSLRFKTNLLPLIGHENELNQLAHITALTSDE